MLGTANSAWESGLPIFQDCPDQQVANNIVNNSGTVAARNRTTLVPPARERRVGAERGGSCTNAAAQYSCTRGSRCAACDLHPTTHNLSISIRSLHGSLQGLAAVGDKLVLDVANVVLEPSCVELSLKRRYLDTQALHLVLD